MTTTLRIFYSIDQDALAFNAENGITEDQAVELAYDAIKSHFPTARVTVETTTGEGKCYVERYDAEGNADYEAGDDGISETIIDAINVATDQRMVDIAHEG